MYDAFIHDACIHDVMHVSLIHVSMMHVFMMQVPMILDPDTCMYDAYINVPGSLTLMHHHLCTMRTLGGALGVTEQ